MFENRGYKSEPKYLNLKNHGYVMVFYLFIYLYFCDVAKLAIIHMKIWPNLAIDQIWKELFIESFYKLGYLQERDAEIWQLYYFFNFFFWNLVN
jgi:hypothetical protein